MAWTRTEYKWVAVNGEDKMLAKFVGVDGDDESTLPDGYAPGSIAVIPDSDVTMFMVDGAGAWGALQ